MNFYVFSRCTSIFTLLLSGVLAEQPGNPTVHDEFLTSDEYTDTEYASVSPRGNLHRPPASNQSCLPDLENSFQRVWTLTKFLYQATERGFDNYPNADAWNGQLFPYSRTLEMELHNDHGGFTTTCAFDDPILDNATDKWWHCTSPQNPHALSKIPIETYIQLNRTTGHLSVNQTWYCNGTSTDPGPPYRVTAKGSLPDGPTRRLVCGRSTAVARNVICNTMIAPIWCDVLYGAEWCSLGGDRDGRGALLEFWATEVGVGRLKEGWEEGLDGRDDAGGG